jgi:parvulin-like peptidyl-prolyl isomerase
MTRRLFASTFLAASALLAGCGSGAGLRSSDIAVVCGQHVTKAQFDAFLKQGQALYKQQNQTFPAPGSSRYTQIVQHVVLNLVQHAEYEFGAAQLGVTVSQADVDAQLNQIVTAQFGGNRAKFLAALAKTGMDEQDMRNSLRSNLLQQRITDKLTQKARVDDQAIQAYYDKHRAQYETQPSRLVRDILVGKQALASRLEAQLAHGASFSALARLNSIDKGTRAAGRRFVADRGTLVAGLQHLVFSLPTNRVTQPVATPVGWEIVQPLGPVQPPRQVPLKQVRLAIVQYLLGQRRQVIVTAWFAGIQRQCARGTRYAKGFALTSTNG